jgi:predicted anti-sigma-YlaC factor YlaD
VSRRRRVEQHLSVVGVDGGAGVSCDECENALSAMADNEPSHLAGDVIDQHLAGCVSCRRYRDAIGTLPVSPTLASVDPAGDTPGRIARAVARVDRQTSPDSVRYMLLAVAIAIIALSVPDLLASETSAAAAHAGRHLGSFSVAYGVLLLVTAIRPARARTALPVAAVLAAAIGINAATDLIRGKIPLVGETLHIPELLSALLVWRLARRTAT